jgi:carbamoyltransferase
LEEVVKVPPSNSTTRLCQTLLPFLGLGHLDDQAAVAMAPDGDAAAFRPQIQDLYELLPDGDYALHLERVGQLLGAVEPRGGEGPAQQHKDLAAALQEAQEEIVLHVLRHHRRAAGLPHLCLAGGIVENSTTNGKVLASGLFDEVFVHPSPTDAGCALGAALMACQEAGAPAPRQRLRHVCWGTEAGEAGSVEAELERWGAFLACERSPDVARRTAERLAQGAVVGWVQGRSEFSPRALGNRNVLADPRSAANRTRVDAALKRPPGTVAVTPSVLEEDARDFFELPGGTDSFPYMAFAVKVREDRRQALAAAIHADGRAWLQTVSRETNPRYWQLIKAFKDLTGIPAVLSTSFCSGAEPIVDSVEDAVVSFLTTELDELVIGDFVARRGTPAHDDWLSLRLSLRPYVVLQQTRRFVTPARMAASLRIRTTYDAAVSVPVSDELFSLLMGLAGEQRLEELFGDHGTAADLQRALLAEIDGLWRKRLVRLRAG